MRKSLIVLLVLTVFSAVRAEDGHQLWLRYQPINKAKVITTLQSPTIDIILQELESYYRGEAIALKLGRHTGRVASRLPTAPAQPLGQP